MKQLLSRREKTHQEMSNAGDFFVVADSQAVLRLRFFVMGRLGDDPVLVLELAKERIKTIPLQEK